jgi:hypothetical protein
MRTLITWWGLPLLLCLWGCDDDGSNGGGDVADASGDATSDVTSDTDASADLLETGPDVAEDSTGDASGDASEETAGDAGDEVTPCDHWDLEVALLECDGELEMLTFWSDLSGAPACPDYWSFGGLGRYASLEEAATARGCSMDCVYGLSMAVMFLHCGHRDEYFAWEAAGEECETVLQFSTGFFDGIAEYREDNPCACGANQILLEWPRSGYLVDFSAAGENGYVWVTSTGGVSHIASFVSGGIGELGVPGGPTEASSQFNPGYSYRLVPDSVTFSESGNELCDATPCTVEEQWAEWSASPNTWCPSTFEALAIYDCTDGDGNYCEQVWPL